MCFVGLGVFPLRLDFSILQLSQGCVYGMVFRPPGKTLMQTHFLGQINSRSRAGAPGMPRGTWGWGLSCAGAGHTNEMLQPQPGAPCPNQTLPFQENAGLSKHLVLGFVIPAQVFRNHHKFLAGCALLLKCKSRMQGDLWELKGLKLSVIFPVTLRALSEKITSLWSLWDMMQSQIRHFSIK